MKLVRNILLFLLPLILLPCVASPQESSPSRDPVFRAARKAQQEGRLADAAKILNDRIHEIEQTEPNSPQLALYLNLLATISSIKRQSPDAHTIYQRALEIDRAAFGPGDSRSLRDLVNVAGTLGPGKDEEKEQLLKQAHELAVQNPNLDPGEMAAILANLAAFYKDEQRWYDAEPLAERGMKICASMRLPGTCEFLQSTLAEVYRGEGRTVAAGQVDGINIDSGFSPELDALNKSASQYEKDGLYVQAEFTYRQAIAWIEAHPTRTEGKVVAVQTSMLPAEYDGIGRVLAMQGRKELAEESFKKALASQEALATESPMAVGSFNFSGLMDLYREQGRLNELEPMLHHAIELQEKFLGESSTNVAHTLKILADLYKQEGKDAQAEPLYERAMKIEEVNLGPNKR
jgi:tetratricopeptide (TPR) repeat protein